MPEDLPILFNDDGELLLDASLWEPIRNLLINDN